MELVKIGNITDIQENYNIGCSENLGDSYNNLILYKKHLNFIHSDLQNNNILKKTKNIHLKFTKFMNVSVSNGIKKKFINDYKILQNYKIYYY